jgi:hypothetical protein
LSALGFSDFLQNFRSDRSHGAAPRRDEQGHEICRKDSTVQR